MNNKKIILIITIFILLEIIAFLFINYAHKKLVSNYLQKNTSQLEFTYKAVQKTFSLMTETVVSQIIGRNDVVELYRKAYKANTKKKTIIRDSLYNMLIANYEYLKMKNIRQLHFHLPNNESFLRFHRPFKFGDNLTDVRYSVKMANKNKHNYSGFEEGRIFNGFRYVFPLYYKSQHIGSVETSFSFKAIKQQVVQQGYQNIGFMIKKNVIDNKVFESENSNYIQSMLSDSYMHEKKFLHYKNEILKKIDKKIKSKIAKFINNNENASVYESGKNGNFIISFVSIPNVKGMPVAYIFTYKKDKTIAQYENQALTMHLIIFVLISFLAYFAVKTTIKNEKILYSNLDIKKKNEELKASEEELKQNNEELNYANKKIKESEEKLNLITTNMNDVISVISLTGYILYVSPSTYNFSGYLPEEAVGKHASYFFANIKELPKALKLIKHFAIKRQNGSFKFLYKAKDRPNFPVEVNYSSIKYENKLSAVLVLRNITEQRKIQKEIKEKNEELVATSEELRQSNEELFLKQQIIDENVRKYNLLANNISDFIWMLDLNLQSQYISPSCKKFLGYTEKELSNLSFAEVHTPNTINKFTEILFEIKNNSDVNFEKHIEVEYIHKNGVVFPAEVYAFVIAGSNGEKIGIGGVSRDITEQKQAQLELTTSKSLIESAHKDIMDNIKYAKKIQESLLTSKKLMEKYLGDCFLLFKPKDQVSGDFYYVIEHNDYLVIAVADCTGHGVTGGFLTMLGITYLHEIVTDKNVIKPAVALDLLRERFKNIFKVFGSESSNGMDISLCAINKKNNELTYAGAYNPLWIVRDKELVEYKAVRNPIGFYPVEKPFENTKVQLKNNDIIYLFSDGYQDQVSVKTGKKLPRSEFKELILNISKKELTTQKEILESELQKRIGTYEQVDDITILGVKWKI